MRKDWEILTPQVIAEKLLKDLAYLSDYWMEIEGLDQALKERYGKEWRDKLTEIVSDIVDNEVLKDGSRQANNLWEWLHEYEEVVEYALGIIVESQPYRNLVDYVRERLVEEVMQNRQGLEP